MSCTKKGDVLVIEVEGRARKVVSMGQHAPGDKSSILVAWPRTRHTSWVQKSWVKRVRQ